MEGEPSNLDLVNRDHPHDSSELYDPASASFKRINDCHPNCYEKRTATVEEIGGSALEVRKHHKHEDEDDEDPEFIAVS